MEEIMSTSPRANEENKYVGEDVFLSHSGVQKNFVRQLYKDLTKAGVSCFFDQSHQSLPLGEKWSARIFAAAKTCRVAVLLLSIDFIRSKWPMLELSAFVEAIKSGTNSNLKILPLFFKIYPQDLKDLTSDPQDIPDWREQEEKTQIEWKEALREVRKIKGLQFKEGEDEVRFREEIIKGMHTLLPSSRWYSDSLMQGKTRMCQEVEALFNNVSSSGNSGVHIAGLYGVAGSGKTMLSKAFCHLNCDAFEGKVCYLDFQSEGSTERVQQALQDLTDSFGKEPNPLPTKHAARQMFFKKARGQRVLLALDNITHDPDIINEIKDYIRTDFAPGSRILLCARSLEILQTFTCQNSCIHVPCLSEEEAISILLEATRLKESKLGAKDRGFALKCAKRCCFKRRTGDMGKFHPLALKAFGRYLKNKFDVDFSKWNDELLKIPRAMGDDLHDVSTILEKSYNGMDAEYRTIFMLLAVYIPSKMSPDQVLRWLSIVCNQEDNYINNAVKYLTKASFIERIKPEIGIHDLLVEFAQKKANEMKKWLWVKDHETRQLISNERTGFELIKFEGCTLQTPSMVNKKFLKHLWVLQLVGMQKMDKLNLRPMEDVRSISIHNCTQLQQIEGMDQLSHLAWLQIHHVKPGIKLPILGRLEALRYLEIEIPNSQIQLGDLRGCVHLAEIYVRCPFLSEFPTIKGLEWLEKVEFSHCFNVTGPLDCTGCLRLQSIEVNFCSRMALSPKIDGCSQLSRIIVWQCDAVKEFPGIDGLTKLETFEICISSEAGSKPLRLDSCFGLKNFQLWNSEILQTLPDFSPLSRLTTLGLHKCCITQPPELTCCPLLENISFFTLKNLERFPKFSRLGALKKLRLSNCTRVSAPPDISGCSKLQVFHLLYNDNMEGLPRMNDCLGLEEIKLSWHASELVTFEGIDPDSCNNEDGGDDLEFFLNYWQDAIVKNSNDYIIPGPLKEWRWIQGKQVLVKWYVRGVKLYYSITAAYKISDSMLKLSDEQHSTSDEQHSNASPDYIISEPLKEWRWIPVKQMLVKWYVRGVKLCNSITVLFRKQHSTLDEQISNASPVTLNYRQQISNACPVTLKYRQGKVKFSPPLGGLKVDHIRKLRSEREREWSETYCCDVDGQESLLEAAIDQPGLSDEDCLKRRIPERLWLETCKEWEQKWKHISESATQTVSKERWMEWNDAWQIWWKAKWKSHFEKKPSIAGEEMLEIRIRREWELQFERLIKSEIESGNLYSTPLGPNWGEKVERYLAEDSRRKTDVYTLKIFNFPNGLTRDYILNGPVALVSELIAGGISPFESLLSEFTSKSNFNSKDKYISPYESLLSEFTSRSNFVSKDKYISPYESLPSSKSNFISKDKCRYSSYQVLFVLSFFLFLMLHVYWGRSQTWCLCQPVDKTGFS